MRERFECRPFWFFLIFCFWCLFYYIACKKKKKCLLTNRYFWQQWAVTHYAPGEVLGTRKLTWKSQKHLLTPRSSSLVHDQVAPGLQQLLQLCSQRKLFPNKLHSPHRLIPVRFHLLQGGDIHFLHPSAHLLNLPWRSASQCTLTQKWSSRCLQPGGPHGGTVIFSYRPSIKTVCRCACSRLLYLRCVHNKIFQGPPSTVSSQVDQYRDHLTLEA